MSKPPAMTSIVTVRPPKRSPRKKPSQAVAIGSQIVTAKRPWKRHYGEIVDDPADPPDCETATERARQIIQRRLRSPD
jgi:hypothetical protein